METSLFGTIVACINIILAIGIISLVSYVVFFIIKTCRIYNRNKKNN